MRKFWFFIIVLNFLFAENFAVDLMDKTSGIANIGAGFTGTARPNGVSAPYWNPAGLALLNRESVGVNYYTRLETVNHISIDSFFNWHDLKLGFNFVQEEVPDIPKTVEIGGEGVRNGSFSDTYRMYNCAIAQQLANDLYLGGNLKLITRGIDDYSAFGYGLDVGLLNKVDNKTSLGFNLKNIVSNLSWDNGTNEQLEKKLAFGLSTKTIVWEKDFYVNFDYDLFFGEGNKNTWAVGLEDWLIPYQFALRGGINGYKDITIGLGFYYFDFKTDLAYVMKEEYFDSMFLFSLGFDFRINRPSDAQEIKSTSDNAQQEVSFLEASTVTKDQVTLTLKNIESVQKIAVLLVNKDVLYFEKDKISAGSISFPYGGAGEYVIFFQLKDNKIYKQRISL